MSNTQGQLTGQGIGARARDLLLFLGILVGVVLLVFAANIILTQLRSQEPSSATGPSVVEPIEGSDLKRVTLTEKAAERIALQTAPVLEAQVARQREVGGRVVESPQARAGAILVRVSLSENDLASVDRSQPAVVLPVDDGEDDDEEDEGLEAEAFDDFEDDDDFDEAALYYSVNDPGQQALAPGQPVLVKLALLAGEASRKIVPYSAVIYDVQGETWVYTKDPNALAFVRHNIIVEYIEGDLAFLIEGPPAGTEVVTVGGALLYGAETGVSK